MGGREIDFDGKTGVTPCTEDYVTKRISKHGPKGTTIAVNKSIDSEFCHNMFCRPVGVLDMTEAKMPWLRVVFAETTISRPE